MVNAVNEAYFFRRPIPESARCQAARWIASRQGLPGAYGGLFAGFPAELARGIQLFTGERVTSASARHILGEESCRPPGSSICARRRHEVARRALERCADD